MVGTALRAVRSAAGSENPPYQRGGAARGHVGKVTWGHGEMAGETGQRQLEQQAVLPLSQGLSRWAIFRFASRPLVDFIIVRCVGRLARPRYLPTGRVSAPFSFRARKV
jgi:hypothetical protein